MFSKEEIKTNLLGCFEVSIFMREGVNRFITSKSAVYRSFLIPLLTFPFLIYFVQLKPHNSELPMLTILMAIKVIIPIVLYLALIYQFCKRLDREEYFHRFVVAYNWLEIPMLILFMPVIIATAHGLYEVQQVQSYIVFIILAGYVYLGFIITNILRVSWHFGVFLAVISMAVHETIHDLFMSLNIL